MKHLSFVAFAAAMAIWGLASIPTASGDGASRHRVFSTSTQEAAASSLRTAARLAKGDLGDDL